MSFVIELTVQALKYTTKQLGRKIEKWTHLTKQLESLDNEGNNFTQAKKKLVLEF